MGERLCRQRVFDCEIENGNQRLSLEKILLAYEKMDMDPTYLLTGEYAYNKSLAEVFRNCPKEKGTYLEQIQLDLKILCK